MQSLPKTKDGLCSLRGAARSALESICVMQRLNRDDVLYRAGDAAAGVYILCEGGAKLGADSHNTHDFRLHCGSSVLGVEEVMSGTRHRSTAKVLVASTVAFIPAERFRAFVEDYPEAAWIVAILRERAPRASVPQVSQTLGEEAV